MPRDAAEVLAEVAGAAGISRADAVAQAVREKAGIASYVYALIDPRDGVVRYIGQSASPSSRLISHCTGRHKNLAMRTWIDGLMADNKMPTLQVLEGCSSESVTDAEAMWIERHRDTVLNSTSDQGRGGGRPGAGRPNNGLTVASGTRSIRLPLRLWRALESLAVERRATVNALVREAVEALTLSAVQPARCECGASLAHIAGGDAAAVLCPRCDWGAET